MSLLTYDDVVKEGYVQFKKMVYVGVCFGKFYEIETNVTLLTFYRYGEDTGYTCEKPPV